MINQMIKAHPTENPMTRQARAPSRPQKTDVVRGSEARLLSPSMH
jgi:hypothetical protein